LIGVSVGHHHDHRLRLALGDEVVENLRSPPQGDPLFFISAAAMQQIEDGVSLAAAAVPRRRINIYPARQLQGRRSIPVDAQRSVRDVVDLVEGCVGVTGRIFSL
jgi:hypothetical protein